MKAFKFLIICCALNAVTLGAEVIDLSKKSAWLTPNCLPGFKNGKIICETLTYLKSKKHFVIDEKKSYTISFDAQRIRPNEKAATLYVGYEALDAQGNPVPVHTYQTLLGSFTEVTAAAKKGDTVLRVKDASKWRVSVNAFVIANAKEDFSDLPNKNILTSGVKKIDKAEKDFIVTLRKPLKADIAAGTKVRLHSAGGYFYSHPAIKLGDDKVVHVKATTKGFNNYGWMNRKQFPRGVPKWRIIFLGNDNRSEAGVAISNIKMTIE